MIDWVIPILLIIIATFLLAHVTFTIFGAIGNDKTRMVVPHNLRCRAAVPAMAIHLEETLMNKDEMEAKSWRFGDSGILLIPLSSGKWAIFDRWGTELLCYIELTSESLHTMLLEMSAKSVTLHKKLPPTTISSLSADELGL